MEERVRWSVAAAALLVLPAVLFVSANLLRYGVGVDVVSDALGPFAEPQDGVVDAIVTVLVLVGPVAALVLVLAPIVRLRVGHSDGTVDATLSIRLSWARITVALVALGVLLVLGSYLLAENASCWFGAATAC